MFDMPEQPPLPVELTELAASLKVQGLALPVWIMLESLRPMAWVLSQALLVGEPLTRGFGLNQQVITGLALLQNPAALASLSALLAPQHSRERGGG